MENDPSEFLPEPERMVEPTVGQLGLCDGAPEGEMQWTVSTKPTVPIAASEIDLEWLYPPDCLDT